MKKIRKKTGALLCIIIDELDHIIASESDKCLTKSTERKIVAFHSTYNDLKAHYMKRFSSKDRIEAISFFEDFDMNLKGFIMLMKQLGKGLTFISIIPSWLNLTDVLPIFKRQVLELNRYVDPSNISDYVECTIIL